HAWPNSRTPIDPLTLGLTSLQPHAVVPSLLSVEGKRIVLPAFFQRGRDFPDKTRQTFATAHASVRHAEAIWSEAARRALKKSLPEKYPFRLQHRSPNPTIPPAHTS